MPATQSANASHESVLENIKSNRLSPEEYDNDSKPAFNVQNPGRGSMSEIPTLRQLPTPSRLIRN